MRKTGDASEPKVKTLFAVVCLVHCATSQTVRQHKHCHHPTRITTVDVFDYINDLSTGMAERCGFFQVPHIQEIIFTSHSVTNLLKMFFFSVGHRAVNDR